MSEMAIRNAIGCSSLNLDPSTTTDVVNFMLTFVGDSPNIELTKMYASVAIVCECKKIPSVSAHSMVPVGLTIEKIMNCVGEMPKEEFFSLVHLIASKWPRCPNSLFQKIDRLKTSYRLFKKYRRVCQNVGQDTGLPDRTNGPLSSLGWMVYLTATMREGDIDQAELAPETLPLFLSFFYSSFLGLASSQLVQQAVSRMFSPSGLSGASRSLLVHRYRSRFQDIINQSCLMRDLNNPMEEFKTRPEILERLTDDLRSEYGRLLDSEYPSCIDQASFLGLRRPLTPDAFHSRRFQTLNNPITQRIHFEGERPSQSDIQRSLQMPQVEQSPASTKLQCLAWIRTCIESLNPLQIESAKACYQRFHNDSYANFLNLVDVTLEGAISAFTPTCRDFNHRKTQIFKFFTCCVSAIIQMYSYDELKEVYGGGQSLMSILCLCTEVFNFCYQAQVTKYKEYCTAFGVSLTSGFEPINWFGRFLRLPPAVSEHLFDLERKLLIEEIWKDEALGILRAPAETGSKLKAELHKRLDYHIQNRIREICDESVGSYLIQKAFRMVKLLMEETEALFDNDNIDRTILCCITASLSLNSPHPSELRIMQQVVDQYRRVPCSSEAALTAKGHTGKEVNIIQYYNEIFLPSLEQAMQKQRSGSHWETPKKIPTGEYDTEGTTEQTAFGPNPRHESIFLKKSREIRQGRQEYQRKLIKNIFFTTRQQLPHSKSESSEMLDESEECPHSGSV